MEPAARDPGRVIKGLLVLLAVSGAAATLGAQAAPLLPPVRIGIVVGGNTATFAGADAVNPAPSTRRGSLGGAFVVVPIGRHFAIQPEITGAIRGAVIIDRVVFAGITGTFIDEFKMDYVEVPVLLRYDVLASGVVRPFLIAGPDVAWKTRCHLVASVADLSAGATITGLGSHSCESLVLAGGESSVFRPVDAAATGGGGLSFDIFGLVFSAGARYTWSFTTIDKAHDLRHRVFSGMATVEFPLGR